MYFPAVKIVKERFQLRKFTIFRVTLDHLVAGLEAVSGDGVHPELLVVGGLSGDQGGVGGQRVVDPGVGHQVGLELIQVHIESSIKPDQSNVKIMTIRSMRHT